MNAVCFNLNRSVPVPAWLHDLTFDKVAPLIMWQSCWHSIRKRGTCNSSAICEGVFAALLKKTLRDSEMDIEDTEAIFEMNDEGESASYKNINDWQTTSLYSDISSLDSTSSLNVNTGFLSCFPEYKRMQGAPYDAMRSFDDPPFTTLRQNMKDIKNVKYLSERDINENESENVADFWRCVSQTVDRLVCLLFSTFLQSKKIEKKVFTDNYSLNKIYLFSTCAHYVR